MGGFTFCCGDMGPVMEAKGTVTNEILEMIEDDPRVCYINADGTGRGGRVQQAQLRYPDRILDVGIQEMNMVTIAAGLAKEGFLPYVQTFGPFLCVRALDQIHNDVAYNDYPVRLIGTHAGLSSGYGPTHNTIIEFGGMNSLPNMTMVAPCDAEQCKKLLRKSLNYPKPIYIRIPRGEEPLVYAADHDYDYEIGKAIVIQEGTDLNFIATGMGVYNCVQAARQLEVKGYSVGVIDMHTIKPIDKDAVVHAAKLSGNIITVKSEPSKTITVNRGTGVEKVAANASVAVRNGSIVITADNTEAQVFTAAGTQVATTRVNGEAAIDVVPGIYIVKAAGKVAKVLVK